MTSILSILTGTTCGLPCWYAHEKVCRCSCGGKNHGVLLDPKAEQPNRMAKIDGFMYELHTVGRYTEVNRIGNAISKRLGWRSIGGSKAMPMTTASGKPYHEGHYPHEKGAAIRVKTPTKNQYDWPELKIDPTNLHPYILWVMVEMPEPLWCEGPCEKCDERRFEIWASI